MKTTLLAAAILAVAIAGCRSDNTAAAKAKAEAEEVKSAQAKVDAELAAKRAAEAKAAAGGKAPQKSAFQDKLRQVAADGGDMRGIAKTVASAYVATSDFIGGPAENPHAAQLAKLNAALDALGTQVGRLDEALVHQDPRDLALHP